jgi:hypothetical protein
MIKQARSDFRVESQKDMELVHRGLRMHSDLNFSDLETDALSLYGDAVAPVMEKLAGYIQACKWPITRGKKDETKRLIPEYYGFMDKVASLLNLYYWEQASTECVKQAEVVLAEPEVETAQSAPAEEPRGKQKNKPELKEDIRPTTSAVKGGPGDGSKNNKGDGKSAPGRPAEGFFSGVNKAVDTVAGKGYGLMEPVLQKALSGGFNDDQQMVDRDYTDARHLATLQRLIMTDGVLSEADPEKVVSMYNTLRQMAPSLAGDANVMRVALRSAIQHDGISPFDIKSFLDTESARQKTDYNRRLHDTLSYGGGEMGNRPA